MGKRKHRSRYSDDEKRKTSRSSLSSTSSSFMDRDDKDSRTNVAEDVVFGSEIRLIDYKDKATHKHKKRRKSTESEEKKMKKKKQKVKKEHKNSRKLKAEKSHRHSSPECFGPMPPALSTKISESKKSELAGDQTIRVPGDQRVMAPMTKEQWEKQRNTIRHVFDPETGRNRLVRGNGEILEEIVSKKRHAEISKQATLGDGIFYQFKAGLANQPSATGR